MQSQVTTQICPRESDETNCRTDAAQNAGSLLCLIGINIDSISNHSEECEPQTRGDQSPDAGDDIIQLRKPKRAYAVLSQMHTNHQDANHIREAGDPQNNFSEEFNGLLEGRPCWRLLRTVKPQF